MGLLRKLFPLVSRHGKAKTKVDESSVRGGTDVTNTSGGSSSSKDKTDSKKKPAKRQNSNVSAQGEEYSKLLAAVQKFMDFANARDADRMLSIAADNCRVLFREQDLSFEEYLDEARKIFVAFPDFQVKYKSIKVEKDQSTGAVCCVVRGCIPQGKHTGAPYGFGPYDPIPATGKYVKNAEETFYFDVNSEGKLTRLFIVADGEMTGPAGLYMQIGGYPVL